LGLWAASPKNRSPRRSLKPIITLSSRLHPQPHRHRSEPYDHLLLLLTTLSSSSGEINKALVILGGEEEGHLKKVEDLKGSPSP
jgi:hypothetical protein